MRGQPLQSHVSAWWRCVQMVHGEDLDRLNGGRGSSVHFVWGHRTQQDRPSKAQQTTPYQCRHISEDTIIISEDTMVAMVKNRTYHDTVRHQWTGSSSTNGIGGCHISQGVLYN